MAEDNKGWRWHLAQPHGNICEWESRNNQYGFKCPNTFWSHCMYNDVVGNPSINSVVYLAVFSVYIIYQQTKSGSSCVCWSKAVWVCIWCVCMHVCKVVNVPEGGLHWTTEQSTELLPFSSCSAKNLTKFSLLIQNFTNRALRDSIETITV